jgi:hypothetical protein
MNLRCMYCQTPFTLSMNEKIGALRLMHTENMHHYDAVCPRCRHANSISRERLEMFTPGWQQAIAAPAQSETLETPAAAKPKVESAPAPVAAATPSKPRHSSAAKKAETAAKSAGKAPAKKTTSAAKKQKGK